MPRRTSPGRFCSADERDLPDGPSRPLRSVQRSEGWTPQTIAEHAMPALKSSFYKLDRSADVFAWDPI
jgi:hypothetical protein